LYLGGRDFNNYENLEMKSIIKKEEGTAIMKEEADEL